GDTTLFEQTLTRLNRKPTTLVRSTDRPVPLDYRYSEDPLHEAVAKLLREGRAPIYLVSFTQRECAEQSQNFMSIVLCTKEEKAAIAEELVGTRFSSPYGKEIQKILRHGMGIHHAGLLPKYRVLVERLAQKGLLKIIFGTDTLGVGVNVPIRTVLLTKLCKFDGEKTTLLSIRDFHQICGRAGRKGFDTQGTVVCQAPEHVIENIRNEQKAAGDAKKIKKLVKRKPPEKGYIPWNEDTFRKHIAGRPEGLVSRFRITHSMLLNVLSRPEEAGCDALRALIRNCHEPERSKKRLRKNAFELFRSLVERTIIEFRPFRVNADLQEDFSLNHALSLYAIDTIRTLDPQSPSYALDVLTLVESILENPEAVLRKQVDRLKTEKMREMKAEGVEFDERIARLEEIEHPKPNREFIYDTFNAFSAAHPWVGTENIRPKSIAREMVEYGHSFSEYVREYDLHRSEGVLLRYLSDVYKALVQNVPSDAQNDELYEIGVTLGSMLKQVDSTLIDEWERLRNPSGTQGQAGAAPAETSFAKVDANDVTSNPRAFEIMIRNEAFNLVRALARGEQEPPAPLDFDVVQKALKERAEAGYSAILATPEARRKEYTKVTRGPTHWAVEQILLDPEGHNDWSLRLEVDLGLSRQEARPVFTFVGIGPLS
ncbi:MAG: DUF3516 domain-containing protein, partial [Bdellovibrionales bacterium]|nr:DUF3516 domain-containing protein [Bdellovibrionales bacterium]